MDRQTLDMEGARHGEISAASLQLGDDTIAIRRIATMSVESIEFAPWDMPRNRQSQRLHATLCVANLFFGLAALAWWGLMPNQPSSTVALFIAGVLLILGIFLGIRAAMIAAKIRRREPYYRLTIGTSDARQIPIVDDNRDVLIKIRDIVRHKMDTGDTETVGEFDLNLDIVDLKLPKSARPAPRSPARHELAPASEDPEILFDADEEEAAEAAKLKSAS
ncbi:MAG: hypothetical protein KJ871_00190 [Alphaproteobacteria bacterium]|nr:hypothetical protein [Alphaproteobacteria bacterium]MBU2084670.1 hypothetical protein [Alphaproteobacteria bacterium]MBU2141919.1 hypothetical protein [Alphaproteobacteria bacterium]MBU2198367.1 hypothetical protein [Alphaproteobacteria bacterium]